MCKVVEGAVKILGHEILAVEDDIRLDDAAAFRAVRDLALCCGFQDGFRRQADALAPVVLLLGEFAGKVARTAVREMMLDKE